MPTPVPNRANRLLPSLLVVGVAVMATVGLIALSLAQGWAGSGPAPSPSISPLTRADEIDQALVQGQLDSMSLRDKVALLTMWNVPGQSASDVTAFVERVHPGGLILMGSNVGSDPETVRALTAGAQTLPRFSTLVAMDEEGGDVVRLPWDDLPGAHQLSREDPSSARDVFAQRGALLAEAGVTVNFGVVADVTDNPSSFIASRILGVTPQAAADRVSEAVRGENPYVASTLKHFPGHGSVSGDSHSSVPVSDKNLEKWRLTDGQPFSSGIAAGAQLVMMAHISFPAVDSQPASLSLEWHRILRSELGFTGVAVTDDLLMLQHSGLPEYADPLAVARAAVMAGNDLLLYVSSNPNQLAGYTPESIIDGLVSDVARGEISAKRIDESALRVLTLMRDIKRSQYARTTECGRVCPLLNPVTELSDASVERYLAARVYP